ncbi:MAG: HAMP domain-containing protein [Prevotella sp.]|nr:HAMP domain-containing protein [Prevotella sp.]
MKTIISHIRQSLSLKLTVLVLACVVIVFLLSLGFLFNHSRRVIREEAIARGENVLSVNLKRIKGIMDEAVVVTKNLEWMVKANLHPDSLLAYTNRLLKSNPELNGCSITMEPDFFPGMGNFSAYSIREEDSVHTQREGIYDYYSKPWYSKAAKLGQPCWVEPFDDYNENTLYTKNLIISYCLPIYTDSTLIGVIATDLSFKMLEKQVGKEKPYPNAYSFMIGRDGHFFVHPKQEKVFSQTIFTADNTSHRSDISTLGHEMVAGKKGYMRMTIDEEPCMVFYQPVGNTGWSMTLVCPESDVLSSYNMLGYILIPLVVVGLLLILLLSRRVVNHLVKPLNVLARQTRHIAEGHYDEQMPESTHNDVVGHLQSSFAHMQESIASHVSELQKVNDEALISNEELAQANRKAQEAIEKKNEFVISLTHQVRTPLNVITGFAQVLRDHQGQLEENEVNEMLSAMKKNSRTAAHIINTMMMTSILSDTSTINTTDEVVCNDIARQAFDEAGQIYVHTSALHFHTSVPDNLTILTNAEYLHRTLVELLSNAMRFTEIGSVTLKLSYTSTKVNFIVEDTGPGIPRAKHEHIFMQFEKLDDFTEGLGLGLPIAKRLIELMGGSLMHDMSYINGARFILQLPRTDTQQNTGGN